MTVDRFEGRFFLKLLCEEVTVPWKTDSRECMGLSDALRHVQWGQHLLKDGTLYI